MASNPDITSAVAAETERLKFPAGDSTVKPPLPTISPFGTPYPSNGTSTFGGAREIDDLRFRFERIAHEPQRNAETLDVLAEIRRGLETGALRVAEPKSDGWIVHTWIKRALLLHTTIGIAEVQSGPLPGVELDTLRWRGHPPPECRIPAGSLVREGAYLGPRVTCMPPAVIQIGAFVDEGTFIDSYALIGLCAQIGRGVHIGSSSTVGGYILPLESPPTTLEDNVILGGNCGVYEGVRVGRGAVLMAGTLITPFHQIFDLRSGEWLRTTANNLLIVPPLSIVAMGPRAIGEGKNSLHINAPLIVGTRQSEDSNNYEFVGGLDKSDSNGGGA